MTKGGRREGAGSKPKWGDCPVKKMLFPSELEEQLNAYVRSLVGTEIKPEVETASTGSTAVEAEPSFTQDQIAEICNAIALSVRPSDRRFALKLFDKLKKELGNG